MQKTMQRRMYNHSVLIRLAARSHLVLFRPVSLLSFYQFLTQNPCSSSPTCFRRVYTRVRSHVHTHTESRTSTWHRDKQTRSGPPRVITVVTRMCRVGELGLDQTTPQHTRQLLPYSRCRHQNFLVDQSAAENKCTFLTLSGWCTPLKRAAPQHSMLPAARTSRSQIALQESTPAVVKKRVGKCV